MKKDQDQPHFKEVSSFVNVDDLERGVLSYWDEHDTFQKSLEKTKDGPRFTFYDGPPYATGKPHYGHILQSTIKDAVLRYKTMQGYHVPRRVGWDCHGLPVENLVEKELGIKTKQEIEDDIEAFNQKCRDTVFRHIDDFTTTLKRVGRWADYTKAYATLDRDYMESEWWVFRKLWDQERIYKSFRSTPYCTRCATPLSNFEVSMAYKDKVDTAVYVLLPIRSSTGLPDRQAGSDQINKNVFLLIWTTTPWTLPANVAVAINPDIEYVTVTVEDKHIIMAKDRVSAVFGEGVTIAHVWKLSELRELRYEPLYESNLSPQQIQDSFRPVTGSHVTAEDGTGIVHIAPAFGEEDFEVSKQEGLPVLRTVGTDGTYLKDVPGWAGEHIFAANKKIIEDLQTRGLLLKQESYKHSYPFCWRCDTPLIYYALDSWFLKISDIKETMLSNNEHIHWVPEHVKHGRFAKGIESAPDWAISRNRFWSVPLPVWVCDDCGQKTCVGSIKELQELSSASDEQVKDIHRPYVDRITWKCTACKKGTMTRTPEVLDVWFDSGSMPYSQWHYPFENKEQVEAGFPADFIAESIEMTRAWFYVLHVLATALTTNNLGLGERKPAYNNVIASGLIFAADGQKLSKKLKNYPDIEPTFKTYGADVLRLYLLTSVSLGEPYRFSEKDIQQLKRNSYLTLWNVYSFFMRYANVHGWKPQGVHSSTNLLDKWIMSRTQDVLQEMQLHMENYRIDTAARLFIPCIDDLSNWYVRRSRQRFQKPTSEQEKQEAFGTLYEVLLRLTKMLAPFMPFVTEEMYRSLTGEESVHMMSLPSQKQAGWDDVYDKSILEEMATVRDIVAQGLAVRAKAKIKVRQPLQRLYVGVEELSPELSAIIAEEVNVKEVVFEDVPSDGTVVLSESNTVGLDTSISKELEAEGIGREIIRHGQVLRREAGYALNDHITVILKTEDENLASLLKTQWEAITLALQAVEIVETGEEDTGKDVSLAGAQLHIGVKKVS